MVGLMSDIGNIRKLNEDSMGYHEDSIKKVYIVADGMGGHNAGEIASKIAVEKVIEYLNSLQSIEDAQEAIKSAIEFSNKQIYEFSQSNAVLNGMGTTITACLLVENKMVVANVGDSRCYIISKDRLVQVTKDHSLVQQLVDNGSITAEEAAAHPNKNIITRSLGTAPVVDVDTYVLDLQHINKVLLCTDGLSNSLTEDEIYNIVIENTNQDACNKLIEISKQNGGRDNITVIIFEGECKNDRNFIR
ncbi:putative serine/threonine phosphatase stp [Clostridiales bacterium oral taxon 876 str. F0540]|nr:putative serine/threonine phosphatase stp [Clostridiales bacterium oral taxon 876 str. F0540]